MHDGEGREDGDEERKEEEGAFFLAGLVKG